MDRMSTMLLRLITLCAFLACAYSQCDQGWRPYNSRCYYFSTNKMTWGEAHTYCLEQGGDLMSIQDIHERLWLSTQLGEEIFWIGLNDIAVEGAWEWTDRTTFLPYLSYWLQGQPDNYGETGENCGQVLGYSQGRWNDERCDVERKFICKRPNPNPPTQCDLASGWRQFGSNCYKLKGETRKSWSAARYDCVREGGDLVSITSAAEEQYVTGELDSSQFDLWIGFTTLKCNKISCQVEEGNTQFGWSDASTGGYTNWGQGEPSAVDPQGGSCAAVIKEAGQDFAKWRTHLCRQERPYMCERGLNTICPPGWLSFSGSCYWLVSNTNLLTTWYEAQTKCKSMEANLLIINSQEEQYFINAHLPDYHHVDIPDIWLGLSDKRQDGVFTWVDNSGITYTNWGPGWPRNTASYWDCGQIFTGNYNGKWETTSCYKSLGYVCEMVGGHNVKPTAAPEFSCDPGYLLWRDHCYHFETEMGKNWQDAEDYCVSDNGHLASFHSEEELSFLTAHMPGQSWVGLNDIESEGQFVYTDGTAADLLPWAPGQPDNWHNEDCVHLLGMAHSEAGKLNDGFCTSSNNFICKKGKGQGPPPQPPTSGPGWNEKCGSWMSDPFNDYCYLINSLSMRPWAEARADCVNQKGDLLSITDPFEQSFIHGVIQQIPTGISLWMGGHDSVTEGGWEWTDGSPFRYVRWNAGNPDNYAGEDCLSILINNGKWNDDNCAFNRGYVCKRRGNTPKPPPPHDGLVSALVCEGSSAVLHCPEESVINIKSAFFGRNSDNICPHLDGSGGGSCTVDGFLPLVRKRCENRPFCFLYAGTDQDPCPTVSKYIQATYTCEQKVCLAGLGVEDGNITDSKLSASSSRGSFTPQKARLNGNSCWMPSGSASSSWIQVDLGETKKVTGIVIQGCPANNHWVTKFKVKHSMDGSSWKDYTEDGEFFPGSMDRNTPETQLLGTPVSARFIRVLPLEYNVEAGLRFDVLGCIPDYAITCDRKPNFNFANDRMNVHCPAGCAMDAYNVFGTTVYRGDSNICAAAIHAGVVLNDIGGDCTLLKKPGQNFYAGSTRNGITSRQYSGAYGVSYTFADGELRCPGPDWYEFGEFCYKPSVEKKTWDDAQRQCRSMNAELVSILSMKEQSWLESYLYMATSDVWTGMNDLKVTGFFSWSDGHEATFTYWAPGEPNNHDGFNEDCVEMLHQTGRWNDVSCTELNTYICKMPKAHYPLPSVKPTAYGCPQGWDAYGYSCYWMEETARTWSDAKDLCEDMDGTLLHIGDIYEQAHFTVVLSEKSGLWWIGLRAKGTGGGVDYIWANDKPLTFTHWDRNQPDTGSGTCVAMTTGAVGGFWDDKMCSEEFAFICEKPRPDITPPTPAPTPPPARGCAKGWTALPHHRNCFKLFHNVDWSQKKSWGAAREDCVSRGADLVSIHDQEEEEFLSLHTKRSSKWIGLKHNAVEGGYSWSDGTPLSHTNWAPGEPNNHGGREECVEMVTNVNGTFSFWNDLNCDAHQDWICKIAKGKTPIVPPVPPSPLPAPECGSNPGWRTNNRICYYYNDTDIVDFYTASSRCFAEGANLVSILNEHEQAYVNSMVGTGDVAEAWIGMMVYGITGGEFRWLDGSPVSYTHWGAGEPNNVNGEEMCIQMKRHQGGWNDANCGWVAGYVCKKYPGSGVTTPAPTQPWEGYCPTGWLRFKDKCFLFKGRKDEFQANWTYARAWCREQNGELAVIDDRYENDFVTSYLRDLQQSTWIGLSDRVVENQYGWSDGLSPVRYTNWNTGEPNNVNGVEDCVSISHNNLFSGKWNDEACHMERSFVCYKKKSADLPPPPPTQSPCPAGYVSWYMSCYRLVEEPLTWTAAQAACVKQGGNLASIDTSYDQSFVSGVVLRGKPDAWIGLRRQDGSNVYSWTDGWPVFYTHWGPGEPTNLKGEGCVSMHGAPAFHGTWNDTGCDQPKAYVCKITSETPPPTPPPVEGNCLPFFVPYGSYCYYVNNKAKGVSWPAASYTCQKLWGELASIHSRAEMEFVRNLNHSKKHHLWIGLTRDRNFGWSWTDRTPLVYLNWARGEPNDAFHSGEIAEENCVEMYADGNWNDNNCLQERGFVCRHPKFHSTDDSGNPIFPTADPGPNNGAIAGGVVGAILCCALIFGLVYYVFRVRGVKLSGLSLPGKASDKVDVPAFNNPNFADDSEA